MSKGLEALSSIKNFTENNDVWISQHLHNEYQCVEKELKALAIIKEEIYENCMFSFEQWQQEAGGDYTYAVKDSEGHEIIITKEEFDLLLEVLGHRRYTITLKDEGRSPEDSCLKEKKEHTKIC